MYRLSLYLLFFCMAVTVGAIAQPTRTISGLITSAEDGAILEGVRVQVKGAGMISGSQQDGAYYIPVTDADTVLVFSRDDLLTQEVRLTNSTDLSVQMHKAGSIQTSPFSPFGSWRAVFTLRQGIEVPVIFDIHKDSSGIAQAYFHNAEERFEAGRVQQSGDSLFIFLDQFDNELAFHIEGSVLSGVLRRQDGSGAAIPVKALAGVGYRFKDTGLPPAGDITGTYDISFTGGDGKEEKAVGIFKQEGNQLRGTFLRVTGDARYLEGIVEGDHFSLSSFIGAAPVFINGTFGIDHRLIGASVGPRGGQNFSGVRNDQAALPDPYKLTYLKDGYTSFDLSFPDVDGHAVSLHDKKYKGKVVIVTIGGTWCPNCVDETAFLAPWYKANHARGVEIIALQYERKTDTAYVRKVLTRLRQKYDIRYDQVFGGVADKQVVANSLPSLNTFLAFPTTILIDKKGRVARIHTGYAGPATGKYYEQFVREFNAEIDELLSSKRLQ